MNEKNFKKLKRALEEIVEMKQSEWISVKERLPTKEECDRFAGWFLVMHEFQKRPDMMRYDGNRPEDEQTYMNGWNRPWEVTHFMNLPEPPHLPTIDEHIARGDDKPYGP